MLSPNQSNPNHQFDQLPPQLQDMAQVEALPLLNPLEPLPLVRHEWSRMDKIRAGLCGVAAAIALAHMSEGVAENAMDALHGHTETVSTQQDARHHSTQNNGVENRADPPDLFDFEQQMSGAGDKPEPLGHFRNGQYKHGVSRRPKSPIFRHPAAQDRDPTTW